jgi:hypothetical protein
LLQLSIAKLKLPRGGIKRLSIKMRQAEMDVDVWTGK